MTRSRGDLEEARREILDRSGVSEEDLRRLAEAGSLVGDEWEAWERLRDLDFLLGVD